MEIERQLVLPVSRHPGLAFSFLLQTAYSEQLAFQLGSQPDHIKARD